MCLALDLILLLRFSEQRSALSVGWGGSLPEDLASRPSWDGHGNGGDEQQGHDDESEDPLQGNDLMEKLCDANGSGEYAEGKSDGVILVNYDEEEPINQNGPNEDVSKDSRDQMVGVADHESTIPVDGHKGPSQGPGDNGGMDKARVSVVAEVKGAQVKEVENKDELCPDEVGTDEEHNECEMEEIVEDEVAADARCSVNVVGVGGEQVREVPKLEDKEDDPVYVPNNGVQGEGSAVKIVLVPDTPADCESIVRLVDNIVDRDDNG